CLRSCYQRGTGRCRSVWARRASQAMTDVLADLPHFLSESEPWFRSALRRLVEQPTISPGSSDPTAIVAGAEVAREVMEAAGACVEIVPSKGTPAIIGRFAHPEPRARIVIYNHYDVQPANAANWQQDDPFRFEVHEHPE